MSKRSPIHVCSLSLSPLNEVQNKLKDKLAQYERLNDEERTHDKDLNDEINQLRWVELAMQFNRQTKLQSVLQHLGDKGSNPSLRQVKVRPVFNAWKREILRQRWQEVVGLTSNQALASRLTKRFETFSNQRSQVAAKSITNLNLITDKPIIDLLGIDEACDALDSFQTKESQKQENVDEGFDYIASSAVATITELPTAETFDSEKPKEGIDDEIKQRLKSRGLEIEEEEEPKRIMSASERAARNLKREEVKEKSNGLKITIIIVVLLIIGICAFIFISKRSSNEMKIQQEQCYTATPTPTPKPTKAPKVKPTPTPTPKKGWFF
jgi:hypothetical protein